MRQVLKILILVGVALPLTNCLEDIQCDPGPYYGELRVKVTINDENPEVPLVVYRGRFEKKDTLISEWISESAVYYELEADKYYTATVLYTSGPRQILAIDGKEMSTSEDDDGCRSANDTTLRIGLAD